MVFTGFVTFCFAASSELRRMFVFILQTSILTLSLSYIVLIEEEGGTFTKRCTFSAIQCVPKSGHILIFLYISVKHKLIWIIFGTKNPKEILHECFWTCLPHLKNVVTVPSETSCFVTIQLKFQTSNITPFVKSDRLLCWYMLQVICTTSQLNCPLCCAGIQPIMKLL